MAAGDDGVLAVELGDGDNGEDGGDLMSDDDASLLSSLLLQLLVSQFAALWPSSLSSDVTMILLRQLPTTKNAYTGYAASAFCEYNGRKLLFLFFCNNNHNISFYEVGRYVCSSRYLLDRYEYGTYHIIYLINTLDSQLSRRDLLA